MPKGSSNRGRSRGDRGFVAAGYVSGYKPTRDPEDGEPLPKEYQRIGKPGRRWDKYDRMAKERGLS
jgi:hypothetical protein